MFNTWLRFCQVFHPKNIYLILLLKFCLRCWNQPAGRESMHQTTSGLRSRPRGEEQCHSHPGKINCLLHGDMRQICLYIYIPDISWYQKVWYPNTKLKKYCGIAYYPTHQPPKLHWSAATCFLPTETLYDWEGLGLGTRQLNLSNHQKCAVLRVFEG